MPARADAEYAQGPLVLRQGHVNINTAPREVLRVLAAEVLTTNPSLQHLTATEPDPDLKAPPTTEMEGQPPEEERAADVLADAIVANRPYVSPSELAWLGADDEEQTVFKNLNLYPNNKFLQ